MFENTPVWELAVAVKDENVKEIRRIVEADKPNIDYQETKFGNTLLMYAVHHQKYLSTKTLLELGANPNIHDNYNGSSAIILAAALTSGNDNIKFISVLLKYGADPNDEEVGQRQDGNTTRNTPLLMACSEVNQLNSPIEKVKLLVKAGAKVNYKNEFNMIPLRAAVTYDHYDIVLYLINNGVDFQSPIIDNEGRTSYLWNELRYSLLPIDGEAYKQKMLVVDFLSKKGIQYDTIPIPEYVKSEAKKMYPNNWEDYLKKY